MNEYKTSDIYLAAYLKAKGHKVSRVEMPDKKCFFFFEEDELLKVNKMRFFNEGLINVTQFKNAISDLRILIHNA